MECPELRITRNVWTRPLFEIPARKRAVPSRPLRCAESGYLGGGFRRYEGLVVALTPLDDARRLLPRSLTGTAFLEGVDCGFGVLAGVGLGVGFGVGVGVGVGVGSGVSTISGVSGGGDGAVSTSSTGVGFGVGSGVETGVGSCVGSTNPTGIVISVSSTAYSGGSNARRS